jgi:hypothetical protein
VTSSHDPQAPPPGWYTDPHGPGERWWDGERWTDHVSDVQFVLHPPSAHAPEQPLPPAAAPAALPAAPAPGPDRSRPESPPPIFWALPALVVAMIAGAAGTWVAVGVDGRTVATLSGLEEGGDGWLVVLAALIATIVLAAWVFERTVLLPAVGAVTGLASAAMALYHALDPATGQAVGGDVDVAPGWGVWVALAASLALAAVSVALARSPAATSTRVEP